MNTAAGLNALRALGYDAEAAAPAPGDDAVIRARKSRGQWLAYTLIVDRSGQMRFVSTRLVDPAHQVQTQQSRRIYRVTREQQRITTVVYQLEDADELSDVVRDMERLVDGD